MTPKRIKGFVLILLLFVFFGSFVVCHADNVTWRLASGTLHIEGSGAMENYASAAQTPWYASHENIISVYIASGVTHIGDYALSSLPNLVSVSIGSSVTSIGNYSFYDNAKLMSIHIPGNVKNIGDHAFFRATALTAVSFGEGVQSIGNYTFNRCYHLSSVTLPDSLQSIGMHAFGYCDSLRAVHFGKGLKSLGSNCFYSCYSLSDITIPDSVENLGEFIFSNCSNLQNVTILCPVSTLPAGIFSYSTLATVTLPRTITTIDKRAFMYCDDLKTIYFSGNSRDWNAITVCEDNDILSGTAVQCMEKLYISQSTRKDNAISLTVTTDAGKSGILIVCAYDHEGRFVSMTKTPVSEADTSLSVNMPCPDDGKISVVLWHTIQCFTPLTNSAVLSY